MRVYVRPGEHIHQKTGKSKKVKCSSQSLPRAEQPRTLTSDIKSRLDTFAWKYVPFYPDIQIKRGGEKIFSSGPTGVWKP